ncbi:MAG: quinolinate synthase NadA [Candidatus Omnitrophota bacterium]|jgi:quinolinate synthase
MTELQWEVLELKKEKCALILAHYYQTLDIQEIADHVCDSFELARRARDAGEKLLILCGVRFMAESAKILSPEKIVLLPAPDAGCPMADMIEPEDVKMLRREHPDAAVVCYINSSAAVKAESDICCTSSSAERIVRSLPNRKIIFIPDQNLGAYIASKIPEKEIILFDGFCPTHHKVTQEEVLAAKRSHPMAVVLAHPECRPEVLQYADYIGSTAGILSAAESLDADEFIIGTENSVVERLKTRVPHKRFYPITNHFLCPNMKKTRLIDVKNALENNEYEIILDQTEIDAARSCLAKMVEIKA